jgi:lysophospholipase L1-like esterase
MRGLPFQAGQRVLFLGDSITDCEHRGRAQPLGYGYVMLIDALLAAHDPDLALDIVNRGNDGDTIVDLERRFEQDVVALRPDWLFVMIGVNDVINRYQEAYRARAVDDATYRATWHRLLPRARSAGPADRIVLLEPTPLDYDVDPAPNADLRALAAIVREVAGEHGVDVVPLQERMAAVLRGPQRSRWYQNPTHPDFRGHARIALAILDHLGWRFP